MSVNSAGTGLNVKAHFKKETSYGVPASGNYHTIPFISKGLDDSFGLQKNPSIGTGRAESDPVKDIVNVEGAFVKALDPRDEGYFLACLLGAPVTTDETTHYQHVFKSGAETLPSLGVEFDHGIAGYFPMYAGVCVNSMDISLGHQGVAQVSYDLIGQKRIKNSSSQAGTPTSNTHTPISNYRGIIKKDGVALAGIESASLQYSNNIERREAVTGDEFIEGLNLGKPSVSGSISARFDNTALLDLADDGTFFELEFELKLSDTLLVKFTAHRVTMEKSGADVSGPGGIVVPFNFTGVDDAVEGCALTVVLLNDIDGAEY